MSLQVENNRDFFTPASGRELMPQSSLQRNGNLLYQQPQIHPVNKYNTAPTHQHNLRNIHISPQHTADHREPVDSPTSLGKGYTYYSPWDI